jgi:hypothetical protein
MATLELEADFVKGLRLMFSTSRDAPDALRTMLDEAIRAKYGSSKSLGTFQPTKVKVSTYTKTVYALHHYSMYEYDTYIMLYIHYANP